MRSADRAFHTMLLLAVATVAFASTLHAQAQIDGPIPTIGPDTEMQTAEPSGATLQPMDERPPGPAFTNFDVTPTGPTSMRLVWTPVPGAIGYTVIRDPSTRPQVLTSQPINPRPDRSGIQSFAVTGLRPDTEHSFLVRAEFGAQSVYSARASQVVTKRTLVGGQPTDLAAVAGSGGVTLTWKAPQEASGYSLMRDDGMVLNNRQPVRATTYTDANVSPGTRQYQVMALYKVDGVGEIEGDLSSVPNVTVEVPGAAKSARYRITVNGFVVNHQTKDHMLNVDGWGDEVYLAAYVHQLSPGNATGYDRSSQMYGQTGDDFVNVRIRAGSASGDGGLASNDTVPNGPLPWRRYNMMSLPWEIWSGQLVQGKDLVLVSPTAWESDQEVYTYNKWISQNKKLTTSLAGSPVYEDLKASTSVEPFELFTDQRLIGDWSDGVEIEFAAAVFGMQTVHDRPIGLTRKVGSGFNYPNWTLTLTYDAIEQALAHPSNLGAGVIPLQLNDHTDLEGKYTLYLQVDRL